MERRRRSIRIASLCALALVACHPSGAAFPWAAEAPASAVERADVRTLNAGYARTRSQVLVREVSNPTRAALDYAAYHANFMIADAPPEQASAMTSPLDTSNPFDGLVEKATLTPDVAKTPLSTQERRHPLAFAPLVELLLAKKVKAAEALEDLGSAVRSESWGQRATPGVWSQAISEAYLHDAAGKGAELWVKIEFAPWFRALGELPDQDGDGFPEVYGRARAGQLSAEAVTMIRDDYAARVLSPDEVRAWGNQLSSYWYPSFNTDLATPGARWPDDTTESAIEAELRGQSFASPALVLRGKPQGKPTYEVFLIDRDAANSGGEVTAEAQKPAPTALALPATEVSPDTQPMRDRVAQELAAHGGSFEAWAAQLRPFHTAIRKRLKATPARIKALAGDAGFLFFRNSLQTLVGGDLETQPEGKNPLPVIVEWKRRLQALGVDFLFVPVPSKVEVFPDHFDPKQTALVGQVVNPYGRKLAQRLGEEGVEVVDLLTPLLAARAEGEQPGEEPLYQPQDTHWTDRGLELAAQVLASRIQRYPWYAQLAKHARRFGMKETTFTRTGDLQSRLPEALKKKYKPETLRARQVLEPGGALYDDDPDSPIVVLGDSFTGVYELTDAEHSGLSAHVARDIGYPVDLVMSYGGGPNVRRKLLRRGWDALGRKKLVIWVMAARDLYNYWEKWEPLPSP